MLVTELDSQPSSRPLTVSDVNGSQARTLADSNAHWCQAISKSPQVHVTVSDTRGNDFLSLNGTASLAMDSDEIDGLWNPMAAAFFDNGRESEGIAVLHLNLTDGTYWSAPGGRIGSVISMVRAQVGGASDSGDQGPVNFATDAED